jgi:hypothetical protein
MDSSERLLVCLGAWVILQAAAIAYARGGDGFRPASRYLDLLAIGLLVNLAALCRWPPAPNRSLAGVGMAQAWAALLVAALLPGALGNLLTDCVRLSGQYAAQARSTREFLATGDPARLHGRSSLGIPFWDADALRQYLDDPMIRSILPPPLGDPLINLAREQADTAGFAVDDYDPFDAPFPNAPAVGSYSQRQSVTERQWRSRALAAPPARWLYWEVAGYPAKGTELQLVSADGRTMIGSFPENPKQQWRAFLTSAPAASWQLHLAERPGDHWVAVRGPWKQGFLSGWLQQLLACLDYFLFGTTLLLLWCLLTQRNQVDQRSL